MERYTHQTYVQATLERTANFHHDPRVLKFLTPPPILVQILQAEPLAENSMVDFILWLGPMPVRWKAVHTEVDLTHGFTDIQVEGPFQTWRHRHTFKELDANSTLVTDEIWAEYGKNIWSSLISRIMWLNLPVLFAYRAWATKRIVEKHRV
jgi:ligand-binding SRPBCC domain-containing protein